MNYAEEVALMVFQYTEVIVRLSARGSVLAINGAAGVVFNALIVWIAWKSKQKE